MLPLIMAFQLIALTPGLAPVETAGGWNIARSSSNCVAEMKQSTGTYLSIQLNSDGTNWINLSNPAWKSLEEGEQKISMRYVRLLTNAPIPKDTEEDAVSVHAKSSRGDLRILGIEVTSEDMSFLMSHTSAKIRFGFFKDDKMLTDWVFMDADTYSRLRGCIDDPFAKK